MSNSIYVDPALMEGGLLRVALFVKELNESWVIQSGIPGTKELDKYEQIPREKVLHMFRKLFFGCKQLDTLKRAKLLAYLQGLLD